MSHPDVITPEWLAEDKGPTLIAISVLFMIVDTTIVLLRFWSVRLQKSPGYFSLDDVVIPIAWLFNIGGCIVGILVVRDGAAGRHQVWVMQTDPTLLVRWFKYVLASEWLCYPAIAFPKISVLLLYLRIFTDRPSRLISHALIYILLAYCIAFSVATALQCIPLEYQWNKDIPGGKCFDVPLFWKSLSIPNIVTDVIILVLPIPTILRLRLSTPQKIGLFTVFLSGSIGLIASCIRMASFFSVKLFSDINYDSVELIGWTIAEPGLYLFAACAVKLRPLFTFFKAKLALKSVFSSAGIRRGQSGEGSGHFRMRSLTDKQSTHIDVDASSTTDVIASRNTYEDDTSDRESLHDWQRMNHK